MPTFSYALSSGLLILPFVTSAIIETSVGRFIRQGEMLNLAAINFTPPIGAPTIAKLNNKTPVFIYITAGGSPIYYLIGTRDNRVFQASKTLSDNLDDYNIRFELDFQNDTDFKIFIDGNEDASGNFSSNPPPEIKGNILYHFNYGEWLAASLVVISLIEIFRILYKEVTIANVLEASRKFKIGRRGIDASMESDEGLTIMKFFKGLISFPGWMLSFFAFPTSNFAFYIAVILFAVIFVFSTITALAESGRTGNQTTDSVAIGVCSLFGIFVVFFVLRRYTDNLKLESL